MNYQKQKEEKVDLEVADQIDFELQKKLDTFVSNLISNSEDVPEDISKFVNNNFWNLI